MSNLFFKSESVKKSVKSGLNLVSKQVFKAFLLMSMMLLSWNGWGQGYEIIYPDGQKAANPGEVVTIRFNEDVSDFVFRDKESVTCNYYDTGIWVGIWWDKLEDPGDCAHEFFKFNEENGVTKIDNQTIQFVVPDSASGASYPLHYGKKTEKKENYVFYHKWDKRFEYKGFVQINIVTNDLALRDDDGKCVCPGSSKRFKLENNQYSSLVWSYVTEDGEEYSLSKIVDLGNDFYEIEMPISLEGKRVIIKCRGKEPGSKTTSLELPMCMPIFSSLPDCAKANSDVAFQIENTCPSVTYTLKCTKGIKNFEDIVLTGESYYEVSFNIGAYSGDSDIKEFALYAGEHYVNGFNMGRCDIKLSCPGDKLLEEYEVPEDKCDISIFDLVDQFPITIKDIEGGDKISNVIYTYSENGGEFKNTTYTKLTAGNSYRLRALVSVDNLTVGYCDSKEFQVVDKTPPTIGEVTLPPVEVTDCQYVVPDLEEIVLNNTTDNCKDDLVFEQTPKAGEIFPLGAVEQRISIKLDVKNKSNDITASKSVNVTIPQRDLSLKEVSVDGGCRNAKDGEISGKIEGSLAPYEVTWSNATETGTIPNVNSDELSITGLDNGTYIVVVKDAGGCTVEKENLVIQQNDNPIVVTAKSYGSKPYDGLAFTSTSDSYDVSGSLKSGDELVAEVAQVTLTDVDTIPVEVKSVQILRNGEKDVTCEYNVQTNSGSMMIHQDVVNVKIKGTQNTYDYNGEEQKSIGYEIVSITSELGDKTTFTKDMVAFVPTEDCDGSAVRTDVGKTNMKLNADNFSSLSPNHAVTFEIVEDGWVEIKPKAVTVTITGNTDNKLYNGEEQSVSGYTVEISGELYTESDIKFGAEYEAKAKGTDAGTYLMGLSKDQFTNDNENFDVTFEVKSDGQLTISKRTVTLTSADDEKVYDGTALTNDEVTVSGDGFATGEGATYDVTGTQT
ncbi:MAG: hypothetical protein J6C20_01110, partial [Paludibacteraceae bacterium]|nr:hypothetical protein [Paludibacteraceae bacterium]